MAVVTVTETMVRDSSIEGLANQSGPALIQKFTAKRSYTVVCDDVNDGPVVAGNAAMIPKFGDKHPKDMTLIVNEIEPKAAPGSAKIFIVTVTYQRIGSVAATSPLLEPPELEWDSVPTELPSQFDSLGRLFANTAGEAFDDHMATPWTDAAVNYSYNSLNSNISLISSHVNHANDATWITSFGTIPYYCAVVKGIKAVSKWSLGLAYFRVTIQIAFRFRSVTGNLVFQDGTSINNPSEVGWLDVRANLGNLFINSNGKQQNITLDNGLPPRNPLMLSADGKTVYRTAQIPGGPIFVGFAPFPTASFAGLPIT